MFGHLGEVPLIYKVLHNDTMKPFTVSGYVFPGNIAYGAKVGANHTGRMNDQVSETKSNYFFIL